MPENILSSLYGKRFGRVPESVTKIPGAGSDRSYFRLAGNGNSAVGVVGISRAENMNFIRLSNFLRVNNICVPEVYGVSESGMEYLQQDLGNVSLFSLIEKNEHEDYVKASMESLARMQTLDGISDLAAQCNPDFDRRTMMWDLNYFKYCFLKTSEIEFDESALEDDFCRMVSEFSNSEKGLYGFMYRDCQSRNVMISGGKPYWIDFQGGRRGPCAYDAASFLWQAKACFPDQFRKEMTDVYSRTLSGFTGISSGKIADEVEKMALLRTLQVLGAYGFRGLVEKKTHFVSSIRYGINNLKSFLDKGGLSAYPELERAAGKLADSSRFTKEDESGLTVKVFSFSYKKGYPEDLTGNGGGFMFDCRSLHNPGRYEQFKSLTGMDRPVMDFLEDRGEVQLFLKDLIPPVERAVKKYAERGFTSLQVGFGCTGGQHRSVYCAQKTAEKLAREFPDVRIKLIHREQGIMKIFND